MVNVNRVILAGNLARDPELRSTPGGSSVARFPVAVSKHWKSKDGEAKSETGFYTIVVWSGLAENCTKFLSKGAPVLVEGRLRSGSFLGKDGNKRYFTEVVGDAVTFLGRKREGSYTHPQPEQTPEAEESSKSENYDQVPF